jgi:hypothetical protein
MSVFSHGPQQGFTPQEIDAWLLAAKEKRATLHLQAAALRNSNERHEAFTQMSDLLQQAFEEVRVISASLREGSQCIRDHSTELREHSTQLRARCTQLMERTAQVIPSPQEIHEAERRMLDMFRDDIHHGKPS